MELIIAMTIVAILAGALLSNFFSSMAKGRDSRRKQDLEQIGKALELYYNDNRAYPTSMPAAGSSLTNTGSTVIYMQKIPKDPKTGYTYTFVAPANGGNFKLYSCLENSNDDAIIPGLTVACGGCNPCKYGISSSNTTP